MRDPKGTAEVIAYRIIEDMRDRAGFDFFDDLYPETQDEILEAWAKIISEYFAVSS